jgi:FMN phosphatase YigB (HAD superfamily)
MIKNIIFDLGNVLISFRPSDYFDKNQYPETVKSRILKEIIGSKEWLQLDNGDIEIQDAIRSLTLSTSFNKDEITHIFNLRPEIMFPLDLNVKLLPELKKRGFRLYFLSNFPIDIFEQTKSGYYFFKYFEGGLISAEVKSSKPENRIYEFLLEKYSLLPEESLFIDDQEINVKAAEKIGMKGLATFGCVEISKMIENILSHSSLN